LKTLELNWKRCLCHGPVGGRVQTMMWTGPRTTGGGTTGTRRRSRARQGLTLVHFSAQPEPFLVIDSVHRRRASHKRAYVDSKSGRVLAPGARCPRRSAMPRLPSNSKTWRQRPSGASAGRAFATHYLPRHRMRCNIRNNDSKYVGWRGKRDLAGPARH